MNMVTNAFTIFEKSITSERLQDQGTDPINWSRLQLVKKGFQKKILILT